MAVVKETIISSGFSIVLTRVREEGHSTPNISSQYMKEAVTEIAFEVVNLVVEEDTPNLFHGRLKSAGGSESIEAIYLLDVKVVANQAYFMRRNSVLLLCTKKYGSVHHLT